MPVNDPTYEPQLLTPMHCKRCRKIKPRKGFRAKKGECLCGGHR